MHITDLEGTKIHVTNLELAIAQADAYRHYRHSDERFAELDKTLVDYWNNIYEQLIQLRKQLKYRVQFNAALIRYYAFVSLRAISNCL